MNGIKRFTAFKLSVGLIHQAELQLDKVEGQSRFKCILLDKKEIQRVNLIATVIDKYEAMEKEYAALTLDDGSGTIRVKAWRASLPLLKQLELGDTVLCIGLLRYFQDELYITPDIIKKVDPRYLWARKLELEQLWPNLFKKTKSSSSLRERILELVRQAEPEALAADKLILELAEPVDQINETVKQLLEEGTLFEPKPGKLRLL